MSDMYKQAHPNRLSRFDKIALWLSAIVAIILAALKLAGAG